LCFRRLAHSFYNKDAVRRDTTFIVANPKQLHVSAAQSSHHPVVYQKMQKANYTAIAIHIILIIQFMAEIITTSQSINSTSVTKIKLLMLLRKIVAVYCEIHSVGKMKFLILTASGT
jgi:hypothetical protein